MQDGLTAVKYVREHAADYQVDPNKIGFMGFLRGWHGNYVCCIQCDRGKPPELSRTHLCIRRCHHWLNSTFGADAHIYYCSQRR